MTVTASRILSVKDNTGFWGIDYAWNGFGTWDVMAHGYGYSDAVPVPADYDGDGMVDMSSKDSSGFWGIDFASDGFAGWNDWQWGYNDATWVPVPGKYDSDTKADRAIKNAAGEWYIDDSSNGYGGRLCKFCLVGKWDHKYAGYGDGSAIPNAADYDSDGHSDLSITGVNWFIDSWAPSYSYGAWDYPNTGFPGHSSTSMTAVPGDYDRDGQTDLAWKNNSTGYWYIDFRNNGYATSSPYYDTAFSTTSRQIYNLSQPYIYATVIYGPDGLPVTVGNGQAQLSMGVRYTVDVVVQPGHPQYAYTAGVEANPSLRVPKSLNLENQPWGSGAGPIPTNSCSSDANCGENHSATCRQDSATITDDSR